MTGKIRFFKYGFFILLIINMLFLISIGIALGNGISPLNFCKKLFFKQQSGYTPPIEYYTTLDLINSISPQEQSIKALHDSGNKITITFNSSMHQDVEKVLRSYSITTNNRPIEFTNYKWINDRTFILQLDRSLEAHDIMILEFLFFTEDQKIYQAVRLQYE